MKAYYPANLSHCVEIYVAAFAALGVYEFVTFEKARPYLRDLTKKPGFCGFVSDEAFLFGHVDDYFRGAIFTVDEFAVHPAHQRGGIGRAFMDAVEREVLSRGCTAISLQTSRTLPAFEFYKKLGFREETQSVMLVKPL